MSAFNIARKVLTSPAAKAVGNKLINRARKSEFFKMFRKQDKTRANKIAKEKKLEDLSSNSPEATKKRLIGNTKDAIKVRGEARKRVPELAEKQRALDRIEKKLGFPKETHRVTRDRLNKNVKIQETAHGEITSGIRKLKQMRLDKVKSVSKLPKDSIPKEKPQIKRGITEKGKLSSKLKRSIRDNFEDRDSGFSKSSSEARSIFSQRLKDLPARKLQNKARASKLESKRRKGLRDDIRELIKIRGKKETAKFTKKASKNK
jgi:5'-deoxynucleotidase YfbR-like HD superfamily hydrolase